MKNETNKITYRVWIDQVNQTFVDVVASNEADAITKGYRKWRRECAHSCVSWIEKIRGDLT